MSEAHHFHQSNPETAELQLEIDKRRIVALGRGLLREVNPITGEHEHSVEYYISGMKTWITQEQALALGEAVLEAQNTQTFKSIVLATIHKPTS